MSRPSCQRKRSKRPLIQFHHISRERSLFTVLESPGIYGGDGIINPAPLTGYSGKVPEMCRINYISPLLRIGSKPYRLLKNTHLRRSPHPSLLQRTFKYTSLLRIAGALHLGIFDQPEKNEFFNKLPILNKKCYSSIGIRLESIIFPMRRKC